MKQPQSVPKRAPSVRILIVEDHPLFSQGLRDILEQEEELDVIADIDNGTDAVIKAVELLPDVILMDVDLPGTNGLQATRLITLNPVCAGVSVIVLTGSANDEQLFHALQAGAVGYLTKDVMARDLLQSIRAVAQGHYTIGDTVLDRPQVAIWLMALFEDLARFHALTGQGSSAPHRVETRMPAPGTPVEFTPLTPRETEVLHLVTQGASNMEIAHAMGIGLNTAKEHMHNILKKLAVNNRTEVAMLALRRGWVRLGTKGQ